MEWAGWASGYIFIMRCLTGMCSPEQAISQADVVRSHGGRRHDCLISLLQWMPPDDLAFSRRARAWQNSAQHVSNAGWEGKGSQGANPLVALCHKRGRSVESEIRRGDYEEGVSGPATGKFLLTSLRVPIGGQKRLRTSISEGKNECCLVS